MPLPAIENRVLDAIVTTLEGIGADPAEWLTRPIVAAGYPADQLDKSARPYVFAKWVQTVRRDGEDSVSTVAMRGTFALFVVATSAELAGERLVLDCRADCLRALVAASKTGAFSFDGIGPLTFEAATDSAELANANRSVATQLVTIDFEVSQALA